MKCKKMTRTRCACDFCGKKNWSVGHMRKHELHCTMNPDRECRVCKMVEGDQKPIGELVALLPDVAIGEDEYGYRSAPDGGEAIVNAALLKLREACDDCPACIMAALRQKGILVPLASDFDFSKEMKSIWSEINNENNGY